MFLLKRSGGMSQNINVLMHHFIQSTAPPYKNGLIQKFEGRELKIYTREKHVKKHRSFVGFAMRTEVIYVKIGCQNNKYNSFN